MNVDLLENELIRDEGKRNFPYQDSLNILTIGVGRNLKDRGLTDDEIVYLLKNDITTVQNDLDRVMPWWRSLSEKRQRVLANMCFNLGIGRLVGFKNMLASVKAFDYEKAADEMLDSQWAKQVDDRATRLANMMREG